MCISKKMTKIYNSAYQSGLDTSIIGFPLDRTEIIFNDSVTLPNQSGSESNEEMVDDLKAGDDKVFLVKRAPKSYKKFVEIESLGTEITYRCAKCRGCRDCVKSMETECISIQEEVEQALIDKSVKVNLDLNCTSALLPFLSDPIAILASNEKIALKIYQNQVKNLNKNKKDKEDVKAEKKLHDLGFVEYIENLTNEEQTKLFSSPLLYFLPWRAVWNTNSISIPCRPVFDGSCATKTGFSLNDVLAKGKNTE